MQILKEFVYRLLLLTRLAWVAARLNRGKVLVLAYHDVSKGPPEPVHNFDGLRVRTERFEEQMRYLAARYHVVPLDALLDAGGIRSSKPLAVITIDDGYRDTYRYAFPVLQRLGLPATVFLITDFFLHSQTPWWDRLRAIIAASRRQIVQAPVQGRERWFRLAAPGDRQAALRLLAREFQGLPPGRREALLTRLAADLEVGQSTLVTGESLTADELHEMTDAGITVGSHGHSHDSFLRLSQETLVSELIESKRVLESVTGRPVTWLSYPYGEFSREAIEAAREAGYHGAVTTMEGLNDGVPDPYAVRRIGVDDHLSFPHFIVAVSGLRDMLRGILGILPDDRYGSVPSVTAKGEQAF